MGVFLLTVLITASALGLVWLGYWAAEYDFTEDREALDTQRDALSTEWAALEQARRVNDVFFDARDALRQAEVDSRSYRQGSTQRSGPAHGPRIVDGDFEWPS